MTKTPDPINPSPSLSTSPTTSAAPFARAVIYLRVSTKEQAAGGDGEGFSIPAQREACLRKAQALQAIVLDEFADKGESAKTADRPELQRLLRFIVNNQVDTVIVHKIDRLARNRADDVQINLAIRAAGAVLVSCTENIDETPSGHLMHGIMSSIAEFYSRNLATEVLKGSIKKAEGGGTLGKAPTGYLNIREFTSGVENRTVKIDPVRGPLVAWAFEAYATGDWTTKTLQEELKARGLTAPPTPKRPGSPLSPSNLCRLLRHPYYKGLVRYRNIEYPGNHEPLVSIETWNKVQNVLNTNDRSILRQRTNNHYLKSSIFCGQCGGLLTVSINSNRHGAIYEYFICLDRKKRKTCMQRAMLIPVVESKVEDHWLDIQLPASLIDAVREHLGEEIIKAKAAAGTETKAQTIRLAKLRNEREKLLQGYYAGAVTLEQLKGEQTRITSEIDHAEARSKALNASFETIEHNIDRAMDFAANWHHAYLASSDKERRELNRVLFAKIYIDWDGQVRHDLAEPFKSILAEDIVMSARNRQVETSGRLSKSEGDKMDQAWANLSATWASELDGTKKTSPQTKTKNPRTLEGVEGSVNNRMVGVEGLEPPTPSV
jgi:site-specific DNA recombinase